MMTKNYQSDMKVIKRALKAMPIAWDGKRCILELKEANYNWKQMEWWAFYFEYKARILLGTKMEMPGDRFSNVTFDLKGAINWDLKASAIKTNSHVIILNDKEAMEYSISRNGHHGEIIALCDVEYNDEDRSFQKWHTELKGGKSKYEFEREKRTSISRYRKVRAELVEILLVVVKDGNLGNLKVMYQGRNSNGSLRDPKYMLDLEDLSHFEYFSIKTRGKNVL